jgi:uncharacterized damage-inducible protein DinB
MTFSSGTARSARTKSDPIAELFLQDVQEQIRQNLRHMERCLSMLSEKEVWWRPNAASNSVGNVVLHLCGNMRQWILSGLGGAPDVRVRDQEFSERGPIPRRVLVSRLRQTVAKASRVLNRLSPESLKRQYTIQGFRVTGLAAVSHVYEHFSHHAGQIIYVTKMKRGKDLRFTRLPKIKRNRARS